MSQNEKPRISLCMIVKDEEERLPRCLEAAKPFVDEIVVVDTGSSDRSIEIAESFGAKVVEEAWDDDFSAVRNRSLDEASGDWALVLDADEVISEKAGHDLRQAVDSDQHIGVYLPLRDYGDDGRETTALLFRAFRIRPDLRWQYRIHEQVLPSAVRIAKAEGLGFARTVGEVGHDGYTAEVMEARGKDDRNRRLFERQLQDTPDDLYTLYKYADFLRRFPEDQELAMANFEKANALLEGMDATERRDLTFGGDLCGLHALMCLREATPESEARAVDLCEWGLANCRESANLWYVYGNALAVVGRSAEAENAFRKTRDYHGEADFVPPQSDITGHKAEVGLVKAIGLQGDHHRAADTAWDALGRHPHCEELVGEWANAEGRARDISRFANRLIQRIQAEPSCGTTWMRGGELFLKLRLFRKALPWLLRATELLEDPSHAHFDVGICLLALDAHGDAADHFAKGLPDSRCRAGILYMSVAYGLEIEMEVEADDADLKEALQILQKQLSDIGERRLRERVEEALGQLEEEHPTAHGFFEAALS